MRYDADKNRRRSIRLSRYDYRQSGAYFITVCTKNREFLFGQIADGKMRLNELGMAVLNEWQRTERVRPGIKLDAFVIMPNHLHGILFLVYAEGTARRAPTEEVFGRPVSGSLPTIVRSFKSAAAMRINQIRNAPGAPVWQRNYYEQVIRGEEELHRIREYVEKNPVMWETDSENPSVTKTGKKQPSEI